MLAVGAVTGLVAQDYRRVRVDEVSPHPDNPRRGDVDAIAGSIAADGFYGALVVQQSTGHILAGNHRWLAAKAEGLGELPAIFVDVDDELAKRILLVDNRTADLASWDSKQLAAVLQELTLTDGGLVGTGFDPADLAKLTPGGGDPDDAPPLPVEPITRAGDLWLLGEHRALCGDATDPAAYAVVLDGRRADMVWTDPPYGVDVAGGTHDPRSKRYRSGDTLVNDNLDAAELREFLRGALTPASAASRPGACWFVAAPGGDLVGVFGNVLADLEVWRHTIIWVKDSFVFSRCDYHYQHETIFFGWTPGAGHRANSDRTQSSVWEFDRPKRSSEHPTMKPVALIARAVGNHTRAGDLVLDPFAGSGSTLIAAHDLRRVAAAIDIDPRYVDVICRRYQTHTGDKPVLAATGEPHDFEDGTDG